MTGSVGPHLPDAPDDPFVVNRISDAELDVSVPFELEASERDVDGFVDEAGDGRGSAGGCGWE